MSSNKKKNPVSSSHDYINPEVGGIGAIEDDSLLEGQEVAEDNEDIIFHINTSAMGEAIEDVLHKYEALPTNVSIKQYYMPVQLDDNGDILVRIIPQVNNVN